MGKYYRYGPVDLRSQFRVINSPDPIDAQDVVTKAYALALASGLSPKAAAVSATTAALPACTYANGALGVGATLTGNANGALPAQSGATLVATNRLLVKDQATSLQNGIYTVTQVGTAGTPFILTRATDADTVAENVSGTSVFVTGSTSTLQGSQWILTSAPASMAAGPMVFTQGAAGLSQTTPSAIAGTALVGTEYAAAHGDHTHAGATVAQGAKADTAVQKDGSIAMTGDLNMGTHNITNATRFTGDVTGNLTGNAATVTTNANLTGDVTSVGNAATIGVGKVGPLAAGVGTLSRLVKDTGLNLSQTLTATHILDGFINNAVNTGPYTYTLPTAAAFYAALGSPTLGAAVLTGILFVRGGSTSTITMAQSSDASFTIVGTATIATLKVRIYMWSMTNSGAVVLSSIGVMDA